MAPPEAKDKTEEEILERIAELYGRLEDVREQRKEENTSAANSDGPRVILVTRRLPRDAPVTATSKRKRVPDTMDQVTNGAGGSGPRRASSERR